MRSALEGNIICKKTCADACARKIIYIYQYGRDEEEKQYISRGRVTNVVGTIFRKIFVGTRARPIL